MFYAVSIYLTTSAVALYAILTLHYLAILCTFVYSWSNVHVISCYEIFTWLQQGVKTPKKLLSHNKSRQNIIMWKVSRWLQNSNQISSLLSGYISITINETGTIFSQQEGKFLYDLSWFAAALSYWVTSSGSLLEVRKCQMCQYLRQLICLVFCRHFWYLYLTLFLSLHCSSSLFLASFVFSCQL